MVVNPLPPMIEATKGAVSRCEDSRSVVWSESPTEVEVLRPLFPDSRTLTPAEEVVCAAAVLAVRDLPKSEPRVFLSPLWPSSIFAADIN